MKRSFCIVAALSFLLSSCDDGLNEYDLNRPVGWAACANASADPYDLYGGRGGTKIVLKASGGDDGLLADTGRLPTFIGSGAVNLGGDPLLRLISSHHVWIDHCSFTDGIKCNICMSYDTDFADVTWTVFQYSDKVVNHNYCCLMGSRDGDPNIGALKVTFANDIWGNNIRARVPMCRLGTVHILNNLYSCVGTRGINPRKDSRFLIEGTYFETGVRPFCAYGHKLYMPEAYNWKDCFFEDEYVPEDYGTVTIPYKYRPMPTEIVPEVLRSTSGAGPTLRNPLKINR